MCGLETIGAWSEDPKKKSREKGTDAFYSLREGGKQLPPELLHADSIGTILSENYVTKFYCNKEPPPAKRTDRGLTKGVYNAKACQEQCAKMVSLATATSKSEIEKGSAAHLLAQLKHLESHAAPDTNFPRLSSFAKKGETVTTLLEQRKKLFAANPNLKATLRREAETRLFGGECMVASRGKELEHKFHSYNLEGQPSLTNY